MVKWNDLIIKKYNYLKIHIEYWDYAFNWIYGSKFLIKIRNKTKNTIEFWWLLCEVYPMSNIETSI